MIGRTFGEWKVVSRVKRGQQKYCFCICSCGTERVICRTNLVRGKTRSCGCRRLFHLQETVAKRKGKRREP